MAYAPTRDSELPALRLPATPVSGQAALLTPGARLWTQDQKLQAVAQDLNAAA